MGKGLGGCVMPQSEEVDVQPTGVSIERTLNVVGYILADLEFATEVVRHNSWPTGLDQKDVALLFLASRYQWSVDLLTMRTDALKRDLDGLATQVAGLGISG
jgi:hypothetical protein